jgi:REP element-mobilizing transposase RayT
MKYDSSKHHRQSIRLKGYDYSANGMYFITICAYQRNCLFGAITNGVMHHNEYGQIVTEEWLKSAEIRQEIELGEWVVMPNHIHGIVIIDRPKPVNSVGGARPCAPTRCIATTHIPTKFIATTDIPTRCIATIHVLTRCIVTTHSPSGCIAASNISISGCSLKKTQISLNIYRWVQNGCHQKD